MDIYITKGAKSDPNQFQHDLAFKQVKRVSLSSQEIDLLDSQEGYSVTVYVAAIDENANKLLNNTLTFSNSEPHYIEDVQKAMESIHENVKPALDTLFDQVQNFL